MTIKDDEVVDIETPTGPMRTYVFKPAAPGRYPGIVLYSEVFQVTGPMRRTAALLAGNGFVVAVPEIYHELEPAGTVLAFDAEGGARGNAHKTGKTLAAYDNDIRAALDFLKSHPDCTGKLGAAGFCIGGHIALRAAMHDDVLATSCFYPTDIHKRGLGSDGDNTLDRIGEIKGEMLMIFGRRDPHISREGRELVYKTMTDAELIVQWHEWDEPHAFMRDEGPRYNPAVTQICYTMAIEMFKRKLGEGDLRAA